MVVYHPTGRSFGTRTEPGTRTGQDQSCSPGGAPLKPQQRNSMQTVHRRGGGAAQGGAASSQGGAAFLRISQGWTREGRPLRAGTPLRAGRRSPTGGWRRPCRCRGATAAPRRPGWEVCMCSACVVHMLFTATWMHYMVYMVYNLHGIHGMYTYVIPMACTCTCACGPRTSAFILPQSGCCT